MVIEFTDRKSKSDADAPGEKKKRKSTPAQAEASRRNSAASCGPHDTSQTRLNATKHALCCELPVVMPGEDAQDVQNRINVYILEQNAQTQAEKDAIEVSVMNFAKIRRAHKADTAAETRVVNDVQNKFEDEQALRCDELVANIAAAPAASIIHLRSLTKGILYLLGQVDLLEEHLRTSRSFHPGQRVIAIHLCGKKPCDLFTDRVVKEWGIRYLSGLHGPGRMSAAEAAQIFQRDRPEGVGPEEFERRLGPWLGELVDVREGQALLKEALARVRADLERRYEVVAEREAIDRALAVEAAMVSANPECMRRLRYRRECERGRDAALRQLHQLQTMRLKHGDALAAAAQEAEAQARAEAEVQAAAETEETTPPEPEAVAPVVDNTPSEPVEEIGSRNEAGTPQVAGGNEGTGEIPAYSFVDFAIGRPPGASAGSSAVSGAPDGPRLLGFEERRE